MTQLSFSFGGKRHVVEEKDAPNLLKNLARVQARQVCCRIGVTEEMILDSDTQRQYNLFLERQEFVEHRDPGDENDYQEKQPKHREPELR